MCSNNDISPHDLQAQSESGQNGRCSYHSKKVSDCKDEDLDKIMEELESIAFQIRSDIDQISIRYSLRYLRFLPEEEIQKKLQSIHEFIMRLAEETKELKGRVTVLEGENKELKGRVTVLEGEVKKLKHELESL